MITNYHHISCLRCSRRSQLLHMQTAGRQTIGSNSLNGITHRNEQESPQSCNSEGFHFATWNLTTFLSCYYHMLLPVKSQLKTSRSSPYFLAFVLKTSQNHISESTHISRNGLKSTLSRLHGINILLFATKSGGYFLSDYLFFSSYTAFLILAHAS